MMKGIIQGKSSREHVRAEHCRTTEGRLLTWAMRQAPINYISTWNGRFSFRNADISVKSSLSPCQRG